MDEKPSPTALDLMTIGLASALMVGIGLGLGLLVDSWANIAPFGVLGGLAVGLLCAVGATVATIRRFL